MHRCYEGFSKGSECISLSMNFPVSLITVYPTDNFDEHFPMIIKGALFEIINPL